MIEPNSPQLVINLFHAHGVTVGDATDVLVDLLDIEAVDLHVLRAAVQRRRARMTDEERESADKALAQLAARTA